jgi:hypothetical protein
MFCDVEATRAKKGRQMHGDSGPGMLDHDEVDSEKKDKVMQR